jgi:hypothetical protein
MDEDQFFKEKPETNIFKQIIYKYLPFWPLFVITVSISLIFSYINLRSQVPIFVASATVLLKDPNKGGGDSKVLDALNIFSEKIITRLLYSCIWFRRFLYYQPHFQMTSVN